MGKDPSRSALALAPAIRPAVRSRFLSTRFSQYFNQPADWRLNLRPHEFYEYAYPFEPAALQKIAYHFVDRNSRQEPINRWLNRLNDAICQWWIRWENRDDRDEAQLCLVRGNGDLSIYDSRSGSAFEYPDQIRSRQRFSKYLETPRRSKHVASKFGAERAERELAFLREKDLLFEENGRLISLVIVSAAARHSSL